MAEVPEWLHLLLLAGVLQDVESLSDNDHHDAAPAVEAMAYSFIGARTARTGLAEIAGIASNILPPTSFEPPMKPQIKAKRSAMLKAYAHSIRGLLTLESDLGAAGQALFIASPLQKGIPLGVGDEFINEAVFEHGNAVQSPLSPIYRSGVGNYFGRLSKYVSNVRDVFSSNADAEKKAQDTYLQAKVNADAEYEKAVNNFAKIQKLDPTVKFQEWMNQYATTYADACKVRDELAGKLRPSSVKLAKEMFDDAQARLEPKQGNNMLCAVLDVDIVNGNNAKQADMVYRPRYYLSGYQSAAKRWRNEYREKSCTPEQRIISFEDLKEKSWAQLGIAESDGGDNVGTVSETTFEVTLTYTGMGVFDVKRGLWDINDFRTLLPELTSTAPPDCQQPVYKTTKLLLAYGVDLKVKMPQTVDQDMAKRLRLMPGLLDDLPLTLVQGNELHARPQTNDAYPVLLAVLADKC